MRRPMILALSLCAVAGPAAAETRYLAYDAADRVTQALTRGITLEADRNLFGAISLRRLISTSNRGQADFNRETPNGLLAVLPAGSEESIAYGVSLDGDGRGLTRALCPGAENAWLVTGRVRLARPLKMQAVGRWSDGTFRHCVTLSYVWRGEWSGRQGG